MRSLLFGMILAGSAAHAVLPSDYQTLSAGQKLELLWQKIVARPYNRAPSLAGPGFSWDKLKSFSRLDKAFTVTADELQSGRVKVIHQLGSTAKVVFQPAEGAPYTGILKSGAVGVARLSLALGFEPGGEFVPGMAVKFLVDGQPSRNVFVMERLEGQGADTNFFRASFTNILPDPVSTKTKIGRFVFERFVQDAIHLKVDHLAGVTAEGQAETEPKAPFQLLFQPAPGLAIPSDAPDFRVELAKIPAGTVLYEVYGKETAEAGSPVHLIGRLVTTSEFVSSAYEDETLYFQHAGAELKSGFIRIHRLD